MKFVQARYFTKGRTKKVRLIVIHDMEWAERGDTAEACANWFAAPNTRKASAHYNIDNNSIVQSVRDGDTAWGAGSVNSYSIHFEHAGFASQSRKQWLDAYSIAMLRLSAKLAADLCRKFGIARKHLTNAELRAGQSGFVSHLQVTQVFGPKGGHTDPGPGWPWDVYMSLVTQAYDPKPNPNPGPKPTPKKDEDDMTVHIDPEGQQPGDGIYGVNAEGIFPVSRVRWGVLVAGGVKPIVVSRAVYNDVVKEYLANKPKPCPDPCPDPCPEPKPDPEPTP
jgi:N-acetyl-anhydromuramyl-L-alanine amidase AmpD